MSATILLDRADRCRQSGRVIVCVKNWRATATKDIGTIEVVWVIAMAEDTERLQTKFHLMFAMGDQQVVIYFEVTLPVIETLSD